MGVGQAAAAAAAAGQAGSEFCCAGWLDCIVNSILVGGKALAWLRTYRLYGCNSCGSVTTPAAPSTLSKNCRSASPTLAKRGSRTAAPPAKRSCRSAARSRLGCRQAPLHMVTVRASRIERLGASAD